MQILDERGRSDSVVGQGADRGPVGGVKIVRTEYAIGANVPTLEICRLPVGQRDSFNR